MKRLLMFFLVFALLCGNAAAEKEIPAAVQEAVLDIMDCDWIPADAVPEILEKAEGETYYTVRLVDGQTRETVAVMRVDDLETHRILYYRLADYIMPAWLRSDALFGFDLDADEYLAWHELDKRWNGWAGSVISSFAGVDALHPHLLHCADRDFGVYTIEDPHGDLTAALIIRLPQADQESPEVAAYADVRTNPSSGYDGCLTGAQAESAGLDALRDRFGDDAADHLQLEDRTMLIFDYSLFIEDDRDPDEAENAYDPLWMLYYTDLRANWDESSYVPGYEDAYAYQVYLDAATGEIIWICEEPEEYGYG